ncbi:MAG: nucleotidyltransferase [Acidimicrobiales bacterium]|jgi:hypothetical protein
MDRSEIVSALEELSEVLNERGVNARIYVVGGAAMSLAFSSRYSTEDVVDAYPTEDVITVAREIAHRRGLPEDWLNLSAKQFIPAFKDPEWRPVSRVGNVEMVAADERAMLAMKMRASRPSRDFEDIKFLLDLCGVSSESDAVSLYNEYFPDDPLPKRALPLLRAALPQQNSTK